MCDAEDLEGEAVAVMDVAPARVDRISAEARAMHRPFGAVLLTLVAAVLVGVGRLANNGWFAATWCVAAVKVGWREAQDARRPVDGNAQ